MRKLNGFGSLSFANKHVDRRLAFRIICCKRSHVPDHQLRGEIAVVMASILALNNRKG
jgi:hypothetical protein